MQMYVATRNFGVFRVDTYMYIHICNDTNPVPVPVPRSPFPVPVPRYSHLFNIMFDKWDKAIGIAFV